MDFKVEKINEANAVVSAKITNESIEVKINEIAVQAAKDMKVDGFRKGKVPVAVVKQRYADKIREDAEGDVLRGMIDAALKELSIDATKLVGEPSFTKYDVAENKDIDLEIKLSIKPEVNVDGYKDAIPEVVAQDVSEDEINARVEELAAAQAPMEAIKEDRGLENDDTALMDFEGFLDGVAFEGGKAEGHSLKIGSGSFIPGFEEQMIGMKAGEEKSIKVTFPEEYQAENLKGKETEFKVKLHEIQQKAKPEINDELAKKMYPDDENATVDSMKEKVKEQLQAEKQAKYYNDELKEVLVDNLVAKFSFDLPDAVIEQEMNVLANNHVSGMSEEELTELKDNKEKVTEIRESFRDEATKSVKLTFIIDGVAKAEEVAVSDDEVMQTLYYEALMSGQNPQQIMEYYQKNNLLPAVKMQMIEHKLIHQLLDNKLKGE
jgi:trigger factor